MTGTISIEEMETGITTSFCKASILHLGNTKEGGMAGMISKDGAETYIPKSCLKVSILHSDSAD